MEYIIGMGCVLTAKYVNRVEGISTEWLRMCNWKAYADEMFIDEMRHLVSPTIQTGRHITIGDVWVIQNHPSVYDGSQFPMFISAYPDVEYVKSLLEKSQIQ